MTARSAKAIRSGLWKRTLRSALANSVGCVPELIMKDRRTTGKNPNNPVRRVQIAREGIDRVSGI